MDRFSCLLVFLIFVESFNCQTGPGRDIKPGPELPKSAVEMDPEDVSPDVSAFVEESINELDFTPYLLRVSYIARAWKQVFNRGIKYFLVFEVIQTTCLKTEQNNCLLTMEKTYCSAKVKHSLQRNSDYSFSFHQFGCFSKNSKEFNEFVAKRT